MNISEILNGLQTQALHNEQLRTAFLETRKQEFPLSAFCQLCRNCIFRLSGSICPLK